MISVVYFENEGRNIVVGVFLMRFDAQEFIKNTSGTDSYMIKEVDDWQSWTNIRAKL